MSDNKMARRTKMRLMMAMMGPPASGKTVSSFKIMSYLCEGEPFGVIDTENGRSLQYTPVEEDEKADPENRKFDFYAEHLTNFHPDNYIKAIENLIGKGVRGIVIDSLSHAWAGVGGVLETKAKKDAKGGNSYMNWNESTALQNAFLERLMGLQVHLICTLRTKIEYFLETNNKGQSVPRRVGLTPVQRDDLEYNFDIVGMGNDGVFTFLKDTSGLFRGTEWVRPGLEMATLLETWLNTGVRMPMAKEQFRTIMAELGYTTNLEIAEFVKSYPDIGGAYKYDELIALAPKK